jgi:flagellar biosynthesis protein FliR
LWRVCLPTIGYLLILSAAGGLLMRATQLLNGLALAVIILLLLGVRNAWDLFLWITRHRLHSG